MAPDILPRLSSPQNEMCLRLWPKMSARQNLARGLSPPGSTRAPADLARLFSFSHASESSRFRTAAVSSGKARGMSMGSRGRVEPVAMSGFAKLNVISDKTPHSNGFHVGFSRRVSARPTARSSTSALAMPLISSPRASCARAGIFF